MKKTTLFGLSAILIASIFTACDFSYFDNEIEDFVWDGGIKAPLGYAEYTLSELFEELEVTGLEEDSNGNLSITETKSISSNNESAFDVAIDDVDILSSISTPVSSTDIGGATFPYTLVSQIVVDILNSKEDENNQVLHDFGLDQDLTGAAFSDGTLVIVFTSTFDATVNLTMDIPSFTQKTGGTAYSASIELVGPTTSQLTVNLNEYNADFTQDSSNPFNSIILNMMAGFTFAIGNELRADDKITYVATLSGAKTEVIYGDFKQEAFEVSSQTIDLNFFEDFGNGAIEFSNASLTIKATNGFGFPIGIDVSGIAGDTGSGTASTSLSYTSSEADELSAGTNIMIVDGIETYSAGATSTVSSTTLDKDNSNINTLLSSKPTRFQIDVAGTANPIAGVTNENFYTSTNNGLSVDVIIDVPLEVQFTDVKMEQEDIEFDLGEDISELKTIELKVSTTNKIPLSGTINLNFVKNGNSLGLTKSVSVFKAAPVDATGKSNGSTVSPSSLDFTADELELLKEATHIKLDITFNSPENTSVKLNGSDSIRVDLSIAADVEITSDNEN